MSTTPIKSEQPPTLESRGAFCRRSGIPIRTVSRWMERGLPYIKTCPTKQGRVLFNREQTDAYLARMTRNAR